MDQGEFISIVGASGCGKSTLLRLLLAQETPTRGSVSIACAPPASEPGLDRGTRLSMHDFLTELRAQTGMTLFMVTHDLNEAFKLGDRVLVFDKPRWDPHDPNAYGATITYDFDARDGGIPFQKLKENTHVLQAH